MNTLNYKKLDYPKYKAALMYILKRIGRIEGKKKACKLFYFLDFDYYEAYEKSFTGETYLKYQMGPFPTYFESVVEALENDNYLEIKKERKSANHQNDTVIYSFKKDFEYKFSDEEKNMLERVVRLYGNQNGKMLEDLSHNQAPWLGVEFNEEIPYELSFYRGTEDLKK